MKSFFELYSEFGDACGVYKGQVISMDLVQENKAAKLAAKLIHKEVNAKMFGISSNIFPSSKGELPKYLASPSLENKVEVADAIADSIYVLCQLAYSLGIPLDACYREVHRSNMAKVDPETGKVVQREDGKILKPEGWTKPDLWNILKLQADIESFRAGRDGAVNWRGPTEQQDRSLD